MNPRTSSPSALIVIRHSSFVIPRRGFTLVEMLISMAITLLMMAAVVNLFANIGAGVKIRRATMEMSGELRMMRATLFNDLAGATCKTLPWTRPEEDQGYLEIVEGRWEDTFPTGSTLDLRTSQVPGSQLPPANAGEITDARGLGDYDDIFSLTVRSENAPFKGRAGNTTNESNMAEVVWYAVENPADGSLGEPGMRSVYRRVLLVAPWLSPINEPNVPVDFFRKYDISAHYDTTISKWVPNSLGDLTKRENRFAHYYDATPARGFPHRLVDDAIRANSYATPPPNGDGPLRPFGPRFENLAANDTNREGEDVMLSNVLAFDVRVFDPGAPLFNYNGVVIEPVADNIFSPAILARQLVGFGAYVDLGWDNDSGGSQNNNPDYKPSNFATFNPPQPLFQEAHRAGWHPRDPFVFRGNPAVYDTWSFHYEHDGINQDAAIDNGAGVDQGTNGLDDMVPYPNPSPPPATVNEVQNGVDDIGERETSPPYPVPLRGMQVKIRIYEPDTRQIREATVTRNFVEP